jgi:hypothetical protein
LVTVPANVQIYTTLKPGAVYYFHDKELTSPEPHYFIILNHDPIKDEYLILVCSSSRVDKVKKKLKNCPDTFVEIFTDEYSGFTKDSIIDCNKIFKRTKEQLIEKCSLGELKLKTQIGMSLLEKIRKSVLSSKVVEEEYKKLIRI